MTCIISFFNNDRIVLAGDKIGVSGNFKAIIKEPKVFFNCDFMIGYTTSFRMGQLLNHTWKPTKRKKDQSVENYIYVDTIGSIRKLFEENWFFDKTKEDDWGIFILCYENKIFKVHTDMTITESMDHIAVCGSGREVAKGALCVLLEYEKDIETILRKTFDIVSSNITTVSNEFDYIMSDKRPNNV